MSSWHQNRTPDWTVAMEEGSHRGRKAPSQSYRGGIGKIRDPWHLTSAHPAAGCRAQANRLHGATRWADPGASGTRSLLVWDAQPLHPNVGPRREEWAVHKRTAPPSHQRLPGAGMRWDEMAKHHRHTVRSTEHTKAASATANAQGRAAMLRSACEVAAIQLWDPHPHHL